MVFGISIGSSTVCSAVCVSGRCQVIANAGGDHRPRAVVGKTEHDLCVGAAALSARNTPLFRDVLTNFENNGPTHMMQQQGANVRVDVLLGALITEAVETCRNAKSDGTEVVLSVPDDWDQQKQNDFTKIFEAVSKMEVLRTIKRSAATWVGFNHNSNVEESEENKNKEPKNVLVIHVGGKSATGTLLREENGMISVVKSHRAGPGCDAIVTALVNQLVSEVNRKFRCDVSESRKALLKIESEARRAIEVLSNKETCPIQIESCFEGMDFQTTANRGRLQVTAPYKNILADIFQKFNEKPDEVILSGGGAKSPKIQSLVKSAYSESEVKICSNCDELVAKGCAIQCHIISDRTKLSIDEIPSRIPLSPISIIGKTEDDEINLIAKGAPMPASFTISKNCEIMSPELEDGKNLVSVSGHTTGIFNEKGLFIKNAENSFELLF